MTAYKTWDAVRAEQVARGTFDEHRLTEISEKLRAEVRAHRLAEIRERYNVSQSNLAERIGVSQSRISRLERGDLGRPGIPTIRDYVEALGGEVEIVAKFGDERIVIA